MRVRNCGFAMVCGVLLTCSIPAFGQNRSVPEPVPLQWNGFGSTKQSQSLRIDGGSVSREKYGLYWETRLDPATPALAGGFRTTATDSTGIIHRIMLDRSGRTYFGYDVVVDILPEANTYLLTFHPLAMTSGLALGLDMDRWSEWIPLAAPRFPSPQTVHGGEIVELTLLTNSTTKQRIVDYVSIQEPAVKLSPAFSPFEKLQQRDFSYTTGSPRDIAPTDVELRIQSPRLSINGKLEQSTTTHFEEVAGTMVWIYVPNHGRFIFSLLAHPERGFRKAGEIRGSTLEFKNGADTYSLSAATRIAPGQAVLNLYLRHEPEWKPAYLFADLSAFNMGAMEDNQ